MPVITPNSLSEAVDAIASVPDATVVAGGTDLMVEVNEGHRKMRDERAIVIALNRVPELTTWTLDRGANALTLGAGITWATIEREPLKSLVPALAEAARTVGSPQIRNVGTVGGNLATCSPAGDGLPVLVALEAVVELTSATTTRTMPVRDFMVGVKKTALRQGELVTSISIPLLEGWQGYSKVGVRNAMVIATASACVATDVPSRSIRIALGSVAPTIIRCPEAEALATAAADWPSLTISGDDARGVGELAASASRPIDDHRSTATYRRHAISVMVTRLTMRAFSGTADEA